MKVRFALVGAVGVAVAAGLLVASCDDGDSGDGGGGTITPPPARQTPAAGDYGVGDPSKAALVVYDESPDFTVQYVHLVDHVSNQTTDLGPVPNGEVKVFTVAPGDYLLVVGYYARSSGTYVYWECKRDLTQNITLEAGHAGIFYLRGGGECSVTFTPPDLNSWAG